MAGFTLEGVGDDLVVRNIARSFGVWFGRTMVRKLQPRDRFDYEDEAQPTEAVANEGSRFRFKNLASRLAEVNVDVVHR